MHPNTFLKTFWRMELRPEVFVAMSFDPRYDDRFNKVIVPAVQAVSVGGVPLKANRVDLSKSGDSILTDIMDGIAHAQLVLADISTVGVDKASGFQYRNGNVMFEVGMALACRQPGEVVLLRDDKDKFLFDVSVIPHKTIDFTDPKTAVTELAGLLQERIRERVFVQDARLEMAVASLSPEELQYIKLFKTHERNDIFGFPNSPVMNFPRSIAITRLLDKQVLTLAAMLNDGASGYRWTEFGYYLCRRVEALPTYMAPIIDVSSPQVSPPDQASPPDDAQGASPEASSGGIGL